MLVIVVAVAVVTDAFEDGAGDDEADVVERGGGGGGGGAKSPVALPDVCADLVLYESTIVPPMMTRAAVTTSAAGAILGVDELPLRAVDAKPAGGIAGAAAVFGGGAKDGKSGAG